MLEKLKKKSILRQNGRNKEEEGTKKGEKEARNGKEGEKCLIFYNRRNFIPKFFT